MGARVPVSVIGHMREVRLTERSFRERAGILFLGAKHEPGSPNHDALCWFIDTVLPLIERELGWETRLSVAGFMGPDVSLEGYREHPRVSLLGPVSNTLALFDSHRVFVAPTLRLCGSGCATRRRRGSRPRTAGSSICRQCARCWGRRSGLQPA
jgi:hypothetical protein